MLAHQVLDDQLNANVLQIGVGGRIAGVVPEGQIERVPSRLHIRIIVDQARERSARKRAARCGALEVHVRRPALRVIIVRLVIHKAGEAPRPGAPAEPGAVAHSRQRFE